MDKPSNLRSLVTYLSANPLVACDHFVPGQSGVRKFLGVKADAMVFEKEDGKTAFLLVKSKDGQNEPGFLFTDKGFEFDFGGHRSCYRYLPSEMQHSQ